MTETGVLELKDPLYPEKIKQFVANRKKLYYRGNIDLLKEPAIGIVGSRKCTPYGHAVATEIAKRAAYFGVTVISGLAKGIDGAAHRGTLINHGKTIAVLGCGVDVIYPRQNKDIYEKIAKEGLLLSEYPPGAPAERYNFPTRNRIISALSDALIVVEGGTRSGSLITAECAIEQGKEVFAVPGNINSIYSMGPNKLIRDGAKPLVLIDELFTDMGIERPALRENRNLGSKEESVMTFLQGKGEVAISELCDKTGMPMAEINGILTILEIKGLVYCELGKVMVANFT